jgi:hypothetical protein
MCGGGGGGLFGGGGIGGILGGILGSIIAPELGIPLALASGAGGFLGTTAGDLVSGKPIGTALEEGAIGGLTSGALAGAGNVLAGGDFFGPSAVGFLGGTAPGSAAADLATGATTAASTGAALPGATALTPAVTPAATSVAGAPAAGAGGFGGGDIGSIVGSTGGVSGANLGGAVGAGGQPWGADFAKGIWSGGLTGGEVGPAGEVGPLGAAGPISTGDSGPLTSFMSPLDSSGVGTLGRGDLSLNLTPGGIQTASVPTGGTLTPPAGVVPNATVPTTVPTTTTSVPLDNTPGLWIDGVNQGAGVTEVAGQVPGVRGGGGGLFGIGKPDPSVITATDAYGGGKAGGVSGWLSELATPKNLLTGGAALLPLLKGNSIPGLGALQNQATTFNAMGTPLAQSLNTGVLPQGAASALDSSTRAAEATVRSRFAGMGLSGSSQEADALGMVQAQKAAQKVKMLEDMTRIGVSEMQLATPILQTIMTQRLAQDQQQQQAIARLAAALAGSTGTEKTTA